MKLEYFVVEVTVKNRTINKHWPGDEVDKIFTKRTPR